jgi:N-methylhydantoinase B
MPLASEIYQEGLRIPPVLLCERGRFVDATLALFLANTRVREERLGDLDAQVAALRTGLARLRELAHRFDSRRLTHAMAALQRYSALRVRAVLSRIPRGRWEAEDFLDGDGFGTEPVRIAVSVERKGRRLLVDFSGSAGQVDGPVNANLAVTTSAVFYTLACVAGCDIPANRGLMEPVEIRARPGSIVNCRFPAAVSGGNVETSQRIVDVLFRALAQALPDRIPAASSGTMSNLLLGGTDTIRGRSFAYYETIGGGAGGGPTGPGASALHTHMTNTLNTPVEALEAYFPLRVRHYRVRVGSGGPGAHPGGEGIDREIETLVDCQLSLLADRRDQGPYGLAGGGAGVPGRDSIFRNGEYHSIPAKASLRLRAGECIRIRSPGGGGWGEPRRDQ